MELKLIRSNEVDKEHWDHLIRNSREGNVYGLYTYLSNCEREWMAIILTEGSGRYLAAIPIQLKFTFFYKHIYQDPFTKELGWYSLQGVKSGDIRKMLEVVFSYNLVSKYFFNVDNSRWMEEKGKVKSPCISQITTYYLDISKPYKEISARYSSNRKRDLKKALGIRQEIIRSTDTRPLLSIFKKYTAYKIGGIEEYQYPLLEKLYNQLLQDKIGELYHVEYDGEVVSAVFITRFKNKIVYLFGAHSEKAMELRSSTLVLDYIIRKYSGQDYIFDFEGSDDPGLRRYYSSFGAERTYFYEYRKNELPMIVRAVKGLRAMLIRKLKE